MNTGHLDVRLASGHPDAFCTPCERDVKIVGEESHLSSAKTKKLWGNLSERLSFTAKNCIVQHIPVSGNPNRSSKMPGGFRCYPKLALSSPITQAHPQKPQRLPQTVGSSGFSVETVCKTVKCVWCLVSRVSCLVMGVSRRPSYCLSPRFTLKCLRRKRNVPIASFIPTLNSEEPFIFCQKSYPNTHMWFFTIHRIFPPFSVNRGSLLSKKCQGIFIF